MDLQEKYCHKQLYFGWVCIYPIVITSNRSKCYIVYNDLLLQCTKGHMILDYLNFPMLNPHRQDCKYGPHLCVDQLILIINPIVTLLIQVLFLCQGQANFPGNTIWAFSQISEFYYSRVARGQESSCIFFLFQCITFENKRVAPT